MCFNFTWMITYNNILVFYLIKIDYLFLSLGILEEQNKVNPFTNPEPGTSSPSAMEDTLVTF